MMSPTKAQAASRRRESLQGRLIWMEFPKSRTATKANRPNVGHPDPVAPIRKAPAALEDARVFSVKVVVTVEVPGVTLAGEKEAEHLLGSPVQPKDIVESNEPLWGVTWTAYIADWPAVTVTLVGDGSRVKMGIS
jgi:hypothetical protein